MSEVDGSKCCDIEGCSSIYAQLMMMVYTDGFHIEADAVVDRLNDRPSTNATFGEFYISYPGLACLSSQIYQA